jgi:hypothetical protein
LETARQLILRCCSKERFLGISEEEIPLANPAASSSAAPREKIDMFVEFLHRRMPTGIPGTDADGDLLSSAPTDFQPPLDAFYSKFTQGRATHQDALTMYRTLPGRFFMVDWVFFVAATAAGGEGCPKRIVKTVIEECVKVHIT